MKLDRSLDRLARIEVGQLAGLAQLLESREKIVAVHVRDGWHESERVGDLCDGFGARGRIESSGVRHDLDAPVETRAHDLFHLRHERAGEPRARVLQLRARKDQHGELGEPVTGQDVNRAAVDHLLAAERRSP